MPPEHKKTDLGKGGSVLRFERRPKKPTETMLPVRLSVQDLHSQFGTAKRFFLADPSNRQSAEDCIDKFKAWASRHIEAGGDRRITDLAFRDLRSAISTLADEHPIALAQMAYLLTCANLTARDTWRSIQPEDIRTLADAAETNAARRGRETNEAVSRILNGKVKPFLNSSPSWPADFAGHEEE